MIIEICELSWYIYKENCLGITAKIIALSVFDGLKAKTSILFVLNKSGPHFQESLLYKLTKLLFVCQGFWG